jgi:hypothetical protein
MHVIQALEHPYFTEAPLPCEPADLPIPRSVSAKLATLQAMNSLKRAAEEQMDGNGGSNKRPKF